MSQVEKWGYGDSMMIGGLTTVAAQIVLSLAKCERGDGESSNRGRVEIQSGRTSQRYAFS